MQALLRFVSVVLAGAHDPAFPAASLKECVSLSALVRQGPRARWQVSGTGPLGIRISAFFGAFARIPD
jgi:hypothetical protein